jgi:hypothetical protein
MLSRGYEHIQTGIILQLLSYHPGLIHHGETHTLAALVLSGLHLESLEFHSGYFVEV